MSANDQIKGLSFAPLQYSDPLPQMQSTPLNIIPMLTETTKSSNKKIKRHERSDLQTSGEYADEDEIDLKTIVTAIVPIIQTTVDQSQKLLIQNLSVLNNNILTLSSKVDSFQAELASVKKENQQLKEKLEQTDSKYKELNDKIESLEKTYQTKIHRATVEVQNTQLWANSNEQYSRATNIKIFGLQQQDSEDCVQVVQDLFQDKLGLDIPTEDIDAAHRSRSKTNTGPLPMMVKFRNQTTKNTVIQNRKKLKSTNISIHEDITKLNLETVNRVKNHPKIKSCWFSRGHILAIPVDGGHKFRVNPFDNVDTILEKIK